MYLCCWLCQQNKKEKKNRKICYRVGVVVFNCISMYIYTNTHLYILVYVYTHSIMKIMFYDFYAKPCVCAICMYENLSMHAMQTYVRVYGCFSPINFRTHLLHLLNIKSVYKRLRIQHRQQMLEQNKKKKTIKITNSIIKLTRIRACRKETSLLDFA